MPPTTNIPTDPEAAYEAGKKAGWEMGWKEGWIKGQKNGIDHKHSIVSIDDEMRLSVDFAGFSSEQERESIAAIVRLPDYQMHFRPNMAKQALMKHRQARLYENANEMRMLHTIGDHIMDLIVFYDNALETEKTNIRPVEYGFDSIFPD